MDIFFTKLDPKRFLSTAKKIYEKELKKNEKIYKYIAKHNGKMDEKTLNKNKDKKVIIPVAEEKATPSVNSTAIVKEPKINKDANLHIDFYGKKLSFKFDDKLRLKHRGIKETEVSNYVKELAKEIKEGKEIFPIIYKGVV